MDVNNTTDSDSREEPSERLSSHENPDPADLVTEAGEKVLSRPHRFLPSVIMIGGLVIFFIIVNLPYQYAALYTVTASAKELPFDLPLNREGAEKFVDPVQAGWPILYMISNDFGDQVDSIWNWRNLETLDSRSSTEDSTNKQEQDK